MARSAQDKLLLFAQGWLSVLLAPTWLQPIISLLPFNLYLSRCIDNIPLFFALIIWISHEHLKSFFFLHNYIYDPRTYPTINETTINGFITNIYSYPLNDTLPDLRCIISQKDRQHTSSTARWRHMQLYHRYNKIIHLRLLRYNYDWADGCEKKSKLEESSFALLDDDRFFKGVSQQLDVISRSLFRADDRIEFS